MPKRNSAEELRVRQLEEYAKLLGVRCAQLADMLVTMKQGRPGFDDVIRDLRRVPDHLALAISNAGGVEAAVTRVHRAVGQLARTISGFRTRCTERAAAERWSVMNHAAFRDQDQDFWDGLVKNKRMWVHRIEWTDRIHVLIVHTVEAAPSCLPALDIPAWVDVSALIDDLKRQLGVAETALASVRKPAGRVPVIERVRYEYFDFTSTPDVGVHSDLIDQVSDIRSRYPGLDPLLSQLLDAATEYGAPAEVISGLAADRTAMAEFKGRFRIAQVGEPHVEVLELLKALTLPLGRLARRLDRLEISLVGEAAQSGQRSATTEQLRAHLSAARGHVASLMSKPKPDFLHDFMQWEVYRDLLTVTAGETVDHLLAELNQAPGLLEWITVDDLAQATAAFQKADQMRGFMASPGTKHQSTAQLHYCYVQLVDNLASCLWQCVNGGLEPEVNRLMHDPSRSGQFEEVITATAEAARAMHALLDLLLDVLHYAPDEVSWNKPPVPSLEAVLATIAALGTNSQTPQLVGGLVEEITHG